MKARVKVQPSEHVNIPPVTKTIPIAGTKDDESDHGSDDVEPEVESLTRTKDNNTMLPIQSNHTVRLFYGLSI